MKIMKELDGYSLAMATCACKDFEATGRENDELWLELLIKLEPRALMREDLMQNGSGKFRAFSYKELFMWRLHTLKGCAMMNTKAYAEMAARGDATRALSADASGPSSSELRSKIGHLGRLAVINQEQLFTCDPRPKGGLIYNVSRQRDELVCSAYAPVVAEVGITGVCFPRERRGVQNVS